MPAFPVIGLYRHDAQAHMLEASFDALSSIISASASSLTGKVLVFFDSALDLEQVQSLCRGGDRTARKQPEDGWEWRRVEPNVLTGLPDDDGPSWHCVTAKEAITSLESSPETGLRQAVAAERLERLGPNRLPGVATRMVSKSLRRGQRGAGRRWVSRRRWRS